MAEDNRAGSAATSPPSTRAPELSRSESLQTLITLVLPIALAMLPVFLGNKPAAARWTAAGGIMACYGVFLIARPVWRVGPFEYVSLKIFAELRQELPGEEQPCAKMTEPRQRSLDDIYQQIFGPFWVGVGTALSAFSGWLF